MPELDALKNLGIKVKAVVCLDPALDAIGVAVRNHPEVQFHVVQIGDTTCGDIHMIDEAAVRDIVMQCGPFHLVTVTTPCQGFCRANWQAGVQGRMKTESAALLRRGGEILGWVRFNFLSVSDD